VVVLQALGSVSRDRLIDKKSMKPGDWVLLTKGLAVEGTSILARDFAAVLRAKEISEDTLERCRRFLTDPGISVLREAHIAADSGAVTAMHDITEGGLATALEELSCAGGHRIRVFRDRIPVFPETEELCRLLGLDPLGLIGSGSLLITCDGAKGPQLAAEIAGAGISVARIGEVLGAGSGVEARSTEHGPAEPWPRFEVDEITRLFAKDA